MAKDFNLRLAEEDHIRLDALAAHLAAPAATAIRMLIKMEYDRLRLRPVAPPIGTKDADPFTLFDKDERRWYIDLIEMIRNGPLSTETLSSELCARCYKPPLRGLARRRNALRRHGYARKVARGSKGARRVW